MSRSLNKVSLIGNVGSEPEVKETRGGKKLAKVSLATNREWKNASGQEVSETEWHRLTLWEGLAGVVEEWVHKGDRLYVEGRLHYSQSEDEAGHTRYWTDIVVQNMIMLGGNGAGEAGGAKACTGASRSASQKGGGSGEPDPWDDPDSPVEQPPISEPDDELPF